VRERSRRRHALLCEESPSHFFFLHLLNPKILYNPKLQNKRKKISLFCFGEEDRYISLERYNPTTTTTMKTTLMLSSSSRVVGTTVSAKRTSTKRSITATPAAATKNTTDVEEQICWKNDDDDDVFVGIQKNRFSKLPQMLTTSSVCAAAFADNAFAGTDAEELKNFLIGFWNFRTGDVTSILLYTVAPIALPYLIFSKVREREETSIFISRRLSFVTVLFLHLSFSLTRSIERR